MEGTLGLSLVEILSPCPTYWRMSPSDAMTWIEEEMSKAFPIGRLKG
jgi:pyruvate/2-oxoacid:ferredoxin oxidoreductase beta subunit